MGRGGRGRGRGVIGAGWGAENCNYNGVQYIPISMGRRVGGIGGHEAAAFLNGSGLRGFILGCDVRLGLSTAALF